MPASAGGKLDYTVFRAMHWKEGRGVGTAASLHKALATGAINELCVVEILHIEVYGL